MIDISVGAPGLDLGTFDTQNFRAANIVSIQLGDLEYAPELGIDLKYFLSSDYKFQTDSFKAYLVEVLANNGINVSSVAELINTFSSTLTFNLTPTETSTALIAR